MLTKAGNTFLWTHLVLSLLEDSLLASTANLDSILAALPPSLESTYLSFVAKIPKGNLDSARRLLSLILASSRSLSLEEINYAFTITQHHQTSSDVSGNLQPAIARDPESARDRVPFAQSMGRFDIVNVLSHALNKRQFPS